MKQYTRKKFEVVEGRNWEYIEKDDFAVCMCVWPILERKSAFGPLTFITGSKVVSYQAYRYCKNCLGYGSQPIPISELR